MSRRIRICRRVKELKVGFLREEPTTPIGASSTNPRNPRKQHRRVEERERESERMGGLGFWGVEEEGRRCGESKL